MLLAEFPHLLRIEGNAVLHNFFHGIFEFPASAVEVHFVLEREVSSSLAIYGLYMDSSGA